MTCQSCHERSVFLSETVRCTHVGMHYHPNAETFHGIDARLAALHGYAPVEELEVSALVEGARRERDRQTAAAVQRVEAKLDRLITALQAGAIGAWGNHGRD